MAVPMHAKLRYADLPERSDDGSRYELLDGVLFVTPSPSLVHQRVLGNLYTALRAHFEADGAGIVFFAPTDVILTDHDVLVPDLVVVTDRQWLTRRAIEGPPTIVIEVLSPSNTAYDRVKKFDRYAALGVGHYWIVDPAAHVIECYRNTEGRFLEVRRQSTGPFAHPDFEGLSFDVAGIWVHGLGPD